MGPDNQCSITIDPFQELKKQIEHKRPVAAPLRGTGDTSIDPSQPSEVVIRRAMLWEFETTLGVCWASV